jgi:hypothetical protein
MIMPHMHDSIITALIFVYILHNSIFYPFTYSEILFHVRKDVLPYSVCVLDTVFLSVLWHSLQGDNAPALVSSEF